MYCFKCKKELKNLKKVFFKDTCPFCEADLHICKNCKYYLPGKPNDCSIPNTEFVSDREKFNYCEDFVYKKDKEEAKQVKKEDVAKKLFKD